MEEQNGLVKQEEIQRLLSRALFYLRFRMRTEKEMHIYLSEKAVQYGYTNLIVERVVRDLIEMGYINDQKFVESYVLSHQNVKQKGQFLLRNELLKKGVNEDIVDAYFEKNPVNEYQLATQALEKRWNRYVLLDRPKRFQKAHDFLRRKGFPYSVVKKTIEEMEEKR